MFLRIGEQRIQFDEFLGIEILNFAGKAVQVVQFGDFQFFDQTVERSGGLETEIFVGYPALGQILYSEPMHRLCDFILVARQENIFFAVSVK